jgi:SAM-dependent methyltransferase
VTATAELEHRVLDACAGEADPAFRRRAAWLLARLRLADGQRLLEVGAGNAALLVLAGRLAAVRPVGLDIDLARIRLARRSGYLGLAVVADAGRLPFRSGAFPRVIASEVLEHLEDDCGALAELRRVLDAEGRLGVTVPHARYPWSWDPLARLLEAMGRQPPRRGCYVGIWYGHRRLYRREELRARVEGAGLVVEEEATLVRGALPFAHFLLYGVGKRALEAGLVPRRDALAVGRSAVAAPLPPAWRPVGLAIRVLRAFDAQAERRWRRGGGRSDRGVHLAVTAFPAGAPSAPSRR